VSAPSLTAAPASSDTTTTELVEALHRLGRLLGSRRVFSRLAVTAGVDVSQQALQVLRVLDREDARPVAEVAREARMDVGAVSRQLAVLEELGLASRRPSKAHRSVVLVTTTARGEQVVARANAVQRRHLREALAEWSDEDRGALGRLLGRLVDDLQGTPYRKAPR
jgi:DNA-binding MarR family transcriptional regulator